MTAELLCYSFLEWNIMAWSDGSLSEFYSPLQVCKGPTWNKLIIQFEATDGPSAPAAGHAANSAASQRPQIWLLHSDLNGIWIGPSPCAVRLLWRPNSSEDQTETRPTTAAKRGEGAQGWQLHGLGGKEVIQIYFQDSSHRVNGNLLQVTMHHKHRDTVETNLLKTL